MSTEFVYKKLHVITICICLCVVVCSCFYAFSYRRAVKLIADKVFYFVVSNDLHVEASTHITQLQGGSGYVLTAKGRNYAVYHVYFSSHTAERVKEKLSGDAQVVALHSGDVFATSPRERKNAQSILNCLQGMDSYLQLLNQEINRLDAGATQQSSKNFLRTLIRQLEYFSKENSVTLRNTSKVINCVIAQLRDSVAGIVYTKDLRYALCEFSVGYVQFCREYSL